MKSNLSVPAPASEPSSISQAIETPPPSMFWSLASLCFVAGVFIIYSRFFDIVATGFKIPRIVLSLMILFFLLSGKATVFLRSPVGKVIAILFCWVSLTLPFSIWRSGSVPPYILLVESTIMFAIAAGLPNSINDVRRFTKALAFSGLVAALMGFLWGTSLSGRLTLKQGSYVDPNYYALALIAILPFFWEMASSAKSFFVKIIAWASMLPIFYIVSKTGSRGTMLGFGVMMLVLFIISTVRVKVLLVLVSILGASITLAIMPDYIRARYLTFFQVDGKSEQKDMGTAVYKSQNESSSDPEANLDQLQADVSSAEARQRLLLTSLVMTLEHPLFGVGPGNFPTAVFDEGKAKGTQRNEWLVTHNSYTQISSETGIPGAALFLLAIVLTFRNLIYVFRRAGENGEKPDESSYKVAKYLLLSMTAVSVCIFFLAVGYEFTIYLWLGMAASLRRTYDDLPSAVGGAVVERPMDSIPERRPKPAFNPAYAKVAAEPARQTPPTVGGRQVRFNRFR